MHTYFRSGNNDTESDEGEGGDEGEFDIELVTETQLLD